MVKNYELACDNLCLAIGHSARDTFEMLEKRNINMTAKSFAVGLRLEHPQSFINYNAYGDSAYNDACRQIIKLHTRQKLAEAFIHSACAPEVMLSMPLLKKICLPSME